MFNFLTLFLKSLFCLFVVVVSFFLSFFFFFFAFLPENSSFSLPLSPSSNQRSESFLYFVNGDNYRNKSDFENGLTIRQRSDQPILLFFSSGD